MSTVITPPDLIDGSGAYLVINATTADVEMMISWLKIKERDRIIYLYKNTMCDHAWLKAVANRVEKIIIERHSTDSETLRPLYDNLSKIVWMGEGQQYLTATEYLIKNG